MKFMNPFKDYKMIAIVTLINRYFWKTKIGPIFSILLPFIFMLIYFALGSSIDPENKLKYFVNGLPSYLSMCIIPLSIMTLPAMNIEFKNSIVLRKIKTSGISVIKFNLISVLYFYIATLVFVVITLILFLLFCSSDISAIDYINHLSVYYGVLVLTTTSICFGMLISTIVKSSLSSQLIGFGVFILTLTLSGQFIPIEVISKVDVLKYVSLISPLNYCTNILNIGCLEPYAGFTNSAFDLSKGFAIYGFANTGSQEIYLYDAWQKILFIVMPYILIVSFEFFAIKFFKWTGR